MTNRKIISRPFGKGGVRCRCCGGRGRRYPGVKRAKRAEIRASRRKAAAYAIAEEICDLDALREERVEEEES